MKKKGMSNSSKKIIIIMAILVILFIGLIVALFNIFEKDKVKQEPQYRKGEQQENIKRDEENGELSHHRKFPVFYFITINERL